jgi:polyferredoxin
MSSTSPEPPGERVPPLRQAAANRTAALRAIKVVHTMVWALFAGCVLAIPIVSWLGDYAAAFWLSALVLVEVAVLALNRWSCPLTALAARYTTDRRANFDIYLPEWLARHNKVIFGTIYLVGLATAALRWLFAAR